MLALTLELRARFPDHIPWIVKSRSKRMVRGLDGSLQPPGQWRRSECGRFWRPVGNGSLGRSELHRMLAADVDYGTIPGSGKAGDIFAGAYFMSVDDRGYALFSAKPDIDTSIWTPIDIETAHRAMGFTDDLAPNPCDDIDIDGFAGVIQSAFASADARPEETP